MDPTVAARESSSVQERARHLEHPWLQLVVRLIESHVSPEQISDDDAPGIDLDSVERGAVYELQLYGTPRIQAKLIGPRLGARQPDRIDIVVIESRLDRNDDPKLLRVLDSP